MTVIRPLLIIAGLLLVGAGCISAPTTNRQVGNANNNRPFVPAAKLNEGVLISKIDKGVLVNDQKHGIRLELPRAWYALAESEAPAFVETFVVMSSEPPAYPNTYFGMLGPGSYLSYTVHPLSSGNEGSPVETETRMVAGTNAKVARDANVIVVTIERSEKTIILQGYLSATFTESTFWDIVDTLRVE